MGVLDRIRRGREALVAAAVWNVFDALVHVAADEVEPPRIAGNVAVLVALGLSWVILHRPGGANRAAVVCGLAAGVVLGFNLVWVEAERALPVPAAVFITVSVGLVGVAAWRFLAEAAAPSRWVLVTGLAFAAATLVVFLGGTA